MFYYKKKKEKRYNLLSVFYLVMHIAWLLVLNQTIITIEISKCPIKIEIKTSDAV